MFRLRSLRSLGVLRRRLEGWGEEKRRRWFGEGGELKKETMQGKYQDKTSANEQ
jgi:hypothetical protein